MTYRTFDGTAQTETIVDGRFSSSGDIAISDGSVTQGAIYFADDKNTGIYSPSNDSIAFTTAGSAALTIASDVVNINNSAASSFNTAGDDLIIGDGANESWPGMTFFSHSSDASSIFFSSANSSDIEGLIQYRHLEDPDYMRFMVGGAEQAKFTTHGGIAFGADTAAANTLDDYEEGTWTPAISGLTLAEKEGFYTKVGRIVHIQLLVELPTTASSTALEITGLPVTIKNTTESMAGFVYGYTDNGSQKHVYYGLSNGTSIIVKNVSGGGITQANYSGKTLTLNGSYLT